MMFISNIKFENKFVFVPVVEVEDFAVVDTGDSIGHECVESPFASDGNADEGPSFEDRGVGQADRAFSGQGEAGERLLGRLVASDH